MITRFDFFCNRLHADEVLPEVTLNGLASGDWYGLTLNLIEAANISPSAAVDTTNGHLLSSILIKYECGQSEDPELHMDYVLNDAIAEMKLLADWHVAKWLRLETNWRRLAPELPTNEDIERLRQLRMNLGSFLQDGILLRWGTRWGPTDTWRVNGAADQRPIKHSLWWIDASDPGTQGVLLNLARAMHDDHQICVISPGDDSSDGRWVAHDKECDVIAEADCEWKVLVQLVEDGMDELLRKVS